MSNDSIIPRVRRLIEEDAAYLIPANSVALTKLNPSGAAEGDVATIVNGRATWNVPAVTQAELDAEATTRADADTALDGRLDTIEADYLTSAEGDAAYLKLDASNDPLTGDLQAGASTAKGWIGSYPTSPTLTAAFAHMDHTAYPAIRQTNAGITQLDAALGQTINFRIENTLIAHVDADGIDMAAGMPFYARGGLKNGVQPFTTSGSISATGGALVYYNGSSGQTLTLPAAVAGLTFDLFVTDSADTVILDADGADVIFPGTAGASAGSITLQPGQRARIVSLVAARWDVMIVEAHDTNAKPTSGQAPVNGVDLINKTYGDNTFVAQASVPTFPWVVPLPFTLGPRAGPPASGFIFARPGGLVAQAITACVVEDNSAGTFTNETTDAGSAAVNDVTMPDPFDTNDAIYFGRASKWSYLQVTVGTNGVGDAVAAETAWEYWNGSAWTDLETGHFFTDSTVGFTAGTGLRYVTFEPPSDWATTTVNAQGPYYYIRMRATANDVWNTTQPIITSAANNTITEVEGFAVPVTGTIGSVQCYANTNSGAVDSVFLLVNKTTGLFTTFTWTATDWMDTVTMTNLAVTAGDQLYIQQVQGSSGAQFADGSMTFQITLP